MPSSRSFSVTARPQADRSSARSRISATTSVVPSSAGVARTTTLDGPKASTSSPSSASSAGAVGNAAGGNLVEFDDFGHQQRLRLRRRHRPAPRSCVPASAVRARHAGRQGSARPRFRQRYRCWRSGRAPRRAGGWRRAARCGRCLAEARQSGAKAGGKSLNSRGGSAMAYAGAGRRGDAGAKPCCGTEKAARAAWLTVVEARCPAPSSARRRPEMIRPRTMAASRKRTSVLAGWTFTSTKSCGTSRNSAATGCRSRASRS